MNRVPRASISIAILDDEDYRLLVTGKGGLEAFGVFVALVVAGRERLQQGHARPLSEARSTHLLHSSEGKSESSDNGTTFKNAQQRHSSEAESLRFDNSTTHVLTMIHASRKQFDRALAALAGVAKETGSEPWVYLDETGHVVIRSFFKFNVSDSWGGPRPGAGRRAKPNQDESKMPNRGNQDDSKMNQDDSKMESSVGASYSVSVSIKDPPPPRGGCERETDDEQPDPEFSPGLRLGPVPDHDPIPAKATGRGSLGVNSAADCERAYAAADELFPAENMRALCRQWLADHRAARVIGAMTDAKNRGVARASRYVQAVLDAPETARPNGRPVPAPESPAPRYPSSDPAGVALYAAIKPPGPKAANGGGS